MTINVTDVEDTPVVPEVPVVPVVPVVKVYPVDTYDTDVPPDGIQIEELLTAIEAHFNQQLNIDGLLGCH